MSHEKRKIFVVNHSGHDYSAAEKFGELIFMTYGQIEKKALTEMVRIFLPFILESKEDDLILQSGPSIMTAVACSLFTGKHGKLNLLIFSNDNYKERNLDIKNLLEGKE